MDGECAESPEGLVESACTAGERRTERGKSREAE
jgi:hypothetical protein